MKRCDQCDQPCDTETVHSRDAHGFTDGVYEEFDDEVSECHSQPVYECCRHGEDLHVGLYCVVPLCACISKKVAEATMEKRP